MEAISSFFRYYLLIMSVPIALFSIILNLNANASSNSNSSPYISFSQEYIFLIVILLVVIAVVGFGVMLYVANLRMDAVLYARTINAIRKKYYDLNLSDIDINMKLRTRVLPQSPHLPRYNESRYFSPVVFTFSIFNSFYFICALYVLLVSPLNAGPVLSDIKSIPFVVTSLIIVTLSVTIHFLSYAQMARFREHGYLKSFILGIDIDGVLNDHRKHFCDLLSQSQIKKKTNSLLPEDITTIPLHECRILNVSRSDEKKVFNNVRYWTEMPSIKDVELEVSRIKRFNLKIFIFSHRPWPSTDGLELRLGEQGEDQSAIAGQSKTIQEEWKGQTAALVNKTQYCRFEKAIDLIRLNIGIVEREEFEFCWYQLDRYIKYIHYNIRKHIGLSPIDIITKLWLYEHNIKFDYLLVEQGNESVADPMGNFNNRFHVGKTRMMRYFVEDDLEKAVKMAYICDVVFLLDQPYNNSQPCNDCAENCHRLFPIIPGNVVRVNSWSEIYRHIRSYS